MSIFRTRRKCNVCDSNILSTLYSKEFTDIPIWSFLDKYYKGRIKKQDLDGYKYEIKKCNQCAFIFQSNILSNEGLQELWGNWITDNDSLQKHITRPYPVSKYLQKNVKLMGKQFNKLPKDVNVLDYGMGWGNWALLSKKSGYNVNILANNIFIFDRLNQCFCFINSKTSKARFNV